VVFDQVYNSTLRIHKSVLDKLEPWVLKLMDRGSSRRSATRILAFLINVIPRNHFEPTRLNSQVIWKYFRVRTKWLVETGVLDIESNYVKGKHCRSYLMSAPFKTDWFKPWVKALSNREVRNYVEDALLLDLQDSEDSPKLDDNNWIDNIINLNADPNDIPLVKAFQFLKREDVRGYIDAYVEKLKNIEHPVNVDAIRENISHGVHLVEDSDPGTPSWYQGISYILPAQYMLEHTQNGIFRPNYNRAEIRYFELGLQQLPSGLNKQDVLLNGQVNFDQVGSHAVITQYLFKVIGIENSPLDDYINDRDELANRLGIDVEALKTATMALLNGATLGLYNKKNIPLSTFAPFLTKYGSFNEATDRYEHFVRWAAPLMRHVVELSLQAHSLGAPRRKLANIGYAAQIIEFAHKAITVMTSNHGLLSDQHDGFVLDGSTIDTSMATTMTGVDITYKVKALGRTMNTKEVEKVGTDKEGTEALEAQECNRYHYEKRSLGSSALKALLCGKSQDSQSLLAVYLGGTVFSEEGEGECCTGGSRHRQTKRSLPQGICQLTSSPPTSPRIPKTSGRFLRPRIRSSGPLSLTRSPSFMDGLMSTGYMFTSEGISQRGFLPAGP